MKYNPQMGKLPGLQVARAVAALGVAYFHSWTALVRFPEGTSYPLPILSTYGWLGVDLFFAISGYVIGVVASRGAFDPATFLFKRAARLYPLWWLTLSTFALLALLWRSPTATETISYFLHSASLIETEGFPYYDVGWSLQHELAFYAVAALIIPFLGLPGLAVALLFSSLIYWLNPSWPWYITNLMTYHAEFLAGLLAFFCRDRLRPLGTAPALVIGLIALILLLPFGRYCAPVSLFFLMVGFANMKSSWWTKPLETIGDASYSVYLLHPIIYFIPKSVTKLISLPTWTQEPIRYFCLAAIIALSIASWRFFELPIITAASRFQKSISSKKATAASSY